MSEETLYREFKNWQRPDFWRRYIASPDRKWNFYVSQREHEQMTRFVKSGYLECTSERPQITTNSSDGSVVGVKLTELAITRLQFDYEL